MHALALLTHVIAATNSTVTHGSESPQQSIAAAVA
jgi:hypothetical protein